MSDLASKDRCVGDYKAVWRFTYEYDQQIGRSVDGTGEVETIGIQRVTQFYDVIAVTPELALAAYDKYFGWKFKPRSANDDVSPGDRKDCNYDKHVLKSGPDFMCYIDASISIG